MNYKAVLMALAVLPITGGVSYSAPYPTIAQDVGVCDVNAPSHCAAPDASGNLPVTISGSGGTVTTAPLGVTSTDASTRTITLGGTYQTVFAASATRKNCMIQNPPTAALQGIATAEVLSFKLGANASVFTIPIGGSMSCANVDGTVVQDLITMTAATTAHAFSAVTQ